MALLACAASTLAGVRTTAAVFLWDGCREFICHIRKSVLLTRVSDSNPNKIVTSHSGKPVRDDLSSSSVEVDFSSGEASRPWCEAGRSGHGLPKATKGSRRIRHHGHRYLPPGRAAVRSADRYPPHSPLVDQVTVALFRRGRRTCAPGLTAEQPGASWWWRGSRIGHLLSAASGSFADGRPHQC